MTAEQSVKEFDEWRTRALKAEAQRDGYKEIAEGLKRIVEQDQARRGGTANEGR